MGSMMKGKDDVLTLRAEGDGPIGGLTVTADAFGIKYNGVNYGIMFIGFALGGYIGPILANSLYDNTGSYSVPLMAVGAMGVVALIILFVLTAMKKQAQR